MNVKDFLADLEIRRNRREADELTARRAEAAVALMALVFTIAVVFA
jgi:hypothetical protein